MKAAGTTSRESRGPCSTQIASSLFPRLSQGSTRAIRQSHPLLEPPKMRALSPSCPRSVTAHSRTHFVLHFLHRAPESTPILRQLSAATRRHVSLSLGPLLQHSISQSKEQVHFRYHSLKRLVRCFPLRALPWAHLMGSISDHGMHSSAPTR